jgi:predicted metal-binding membrane protein
MAVIHLRPGGGHAHHPAPTTAAGTASGLGIWLLMVVAMMVPFALPEARWLTRRSLRSRRGRVLAAFAVGVVGPWIALGVVLVPMTGVLGPGGRTVVAVGLLVGAAAWHGSRPRVTALRRCGSLPVPAIRGRRADLSCVAAGVLRGRRCLTTCGPAMAAMAFAPGLGLMVALTALQWSEQGRGPDPHRRGARRSHAAALLVLAVLVGLVGGAR